MRKLQLLTAMAIGISASAIGAIQVEAATYNYFVDFSTKEVANFNDYVQVFNPDTYNLDGNITFYFSGSYRFDTCPTNFTINATWSSYFRYNAAGSAIFLGEATLPDLPCTTTTTTYFATVSTQVPDELIDYVVNDDTDFIRFFSNVRFGRVLGQSDNRIMTLSGYRNYFDFTYDFNTTYLFNYFLSDQAFVSRANTTGVGGTWNITSTESTFLQYVYTTAGNDEYYIINSSSADINTLRKKYAINYEEVYFRGESVGASFTSNYTGSDTITFGTGSPEILWSYDYFFLNTANLSQAIVDAPEFNFTYEDCGWDVFDIPCFINNGLAYITNDAPIISDAITLLNAGIAMAAQTFGIIGAFTTDNVFGYLILAGFGFIAVRWFLKND